MALFDRTNVTAAEVLPMRRKQCSDFEKIRMIAMNAAKKSINEIARAVNRDKNTVRRWVRRFARHRIIIGGGA